MKTSFFRALIALSLTCALLLLQVNEGKAQLLGKKFPGSDALENVLMERIGTALGSQLPLTLNANHAFLTVTDSELPGGVFQGKPLTLTAETILKPLPPGDYTVPVVFFCTEYSVHQPGRGVAYVLGPAEGKLSSAISTLLWRGSLLGKSPQELQAVSWAIQAGVPYSKMPELYQKDITQLLPEFKTQLEGDWLGQMGGFYRDTVAANVAKYNKIKSYVPGIGRAMPTIPIPPIEGLFAKAGRLGQLALDAEKQKTILTANYTSEELRQQTLFQGQGTPLPPQPAVTGPWTEKSRGAAYMRFKVGSGNLSNDNTLEIRILPQPGSAAGLQNEPRLVNTGFHSGVTAAAGGTTFFDLFGTTVDQPEFSRIAELIAKRAVAAELAPEILALALTLTAAGVVGYAQGQGSQAPVLVPSLPSFMFPPQTRQGQSTKTNATAGSKTYKYRGRLQAQGGGTEESEIWNQDTALTVQEGLAKLEKLKQKLTTTQLRNRQKGFDEAETFIMRAGNAGGAPAGVRRSFPSPNRDDNDIRVDVVIEAGTAFVPEP